MTAPTRRRPSEVDIWDVKAAIVSYADRGQPVPETLTLAERKLIIDWFDQERRGTHARTIARIARVSDRTVERRRAKRATGAKRQVTQARQ